MSKVNKVSGAIKLANILSIILTVFPVITSAADLVIKVTDEGEPVPMAEIFLVDSKTRIIINNNFTNKSGIYQFTAARGSYEITVSKDEFLDVTIKEIELNNLNIYKVVELIPREFGTEDTALQSKSDDCD